jgi:hypothetical protein
VARPKRSRPPAKPPKGRPPPARGGVAPRGKHGGARAGAGRKKGALPQESLDRLGAPPLADRDALARQRWWSRLIAELAWLRATGKIGPEVLSDIRGLGSTAARLVPEDLRAEVELLLKDLEKLTKPETHGPKPEEPSDQPPLRHVPR